jgi:Uncharacterized protein conserved in bacteria
MKILLDMNISPRWVSILKTAGLEAVHWSAVGPGDATDVQIMAWAKVENHVVLTYDLDFSAILSATQGDKPSVVQIRAADVSPDVIGPLVIDALRQMETELENGALLTIDLRRTRLRLLPLQSRQ